MIRIISSFIFLMFSVFGYAQKESYVWYFGEKCAINFSLGTPVALNNSAMTVSEGCASICNKDGVFCFYTNGVKVWNRDNKEMPNGKGLKGHDSSTQSAIIIPKPGSNNQFYIFTSDAGDYDSPPNVGVHYSVVDMTKNNGLGDVILKNVLLIPSASEKITAVKNINGKDIWVVVHGWNTNNFYAYSVSKDGVSKTAVISNVGSIHQGGKPTAANSIGQMKLSPDGKKLGVVMFDSKYFELFDFNNATGIISDARMVYLPDDQPAYGCEFSADGSKLYVGIYWKNQVYQYNVMQPSGAQIMNSSILVGQSNDSKIGSMQLAPDGKIYITKNSLYMAAIHHPNRVGKLCGFEDDALPIKYGKLQLGLPAFIQSYFYKPGDY